MGQTHSGIRRSCTFQVIAMLCRSVLVMSLICLSSVQPVPIDWSSITGTLEGVVQQAGAGIQTAGAGIVNAANSIDLSAVKTTLDNAGQQIGQTAGTLGNGIINYANNYAECIRNAGADVNEIAKCTIRNNSNAPVTSESGSGSGSD